MNKLCYKKKDGYAFVIATVFIIVVYSYKKKLYIIIDIDMI